MLRWPRSGSKTSTCRSRWARGAGAAVEHGARALGLRGLNVTIPHKEAALALCTPDELARAVGAVNTLIFDGDAVRGANTDVYGFRKMMEETGVPLDGPRHPRRRRRGARGAARRCTARASWRSWCARRATSASRRA